MNRRAFLTGAAATAAISACGDSSPAPCDANAKGCALTPGLPPGNYFEKLAQDLSSQGYGTPQVIIDLDRLDANAAAIVAGVGAARYRIVEKSLPSIDLLGYVKQQTGSNRFLVLHLPFLPAILDAFPDAQVLVGKPQPLAAVRTFLDGYGAADLPAILARVTFLADSVTRATELADEAKNRGLTLNVGVEIDVGLRRGGVHDPDALPKVLDVFTARTDSLLFGGMLGYDGHVANAPSPPGLEKSAAQATFKTATETYQAYVDVLKSKYAPLVRDTLVFNSGSTSTFPLYNTGPVNDVAAGGGMLRPASYPDLFIGALRPASFIAAPVLAHFDRLELPFSTNISQTLWADQAGFTLYGGGWAAEFVWPEGVGLAPIVNDAENENLVPNQSWLAAPKSLKLKPGDWVFQHPREGDAIFQFEQILLVRGGQIQTDTWRAFPRRY